MKQTLLMIALTFVGVAGVLTTGPFISVWAYYLFAVLRPQYMWEWALPAGVAWSQYVALAGIGGAVGYALGVLPLGGRQDPPFRGLSFTHKAVLLFGVWICCTYVTARDRDVAWIWLIEYLKIFTMFLVAVFVVRTIEQVWTLYVTATLVLIYIAYEVNSLYLFNGRLDLYHRGYGGLDNNGAGLMLAMGVPLALCAWEAIRAPWRWLFAVSIPPLLHAVLMTYSRGAMVSLLIVVPLLAWRSKRRWQFLMVATCLVVTIPFLAGREIRDRFFSTTEYERDASANSRFDSWNAAIRIANDNPVFGVGIRNANLLSYQYGADTEGRTIHSQYFQLLADEGYPGLLLYLAVLGSFFLGAIRIRRLLRGRADPEAIRMRAMVNGLEGAMAVFCIGGTFLSLEVFELPYLMIFLGAQVSVLMRVPSSVASPSEVVPPLPRINLPAVGARRVR